MSHPSRVRGLKHFGQDRSIYHLAVAPLAGAWIETVGAATLPVVYDVAPLAGAWIETLEKAPK